MNTVSQPTAQRLKDAGWKWETEKKFTLFNEAPCGEKWEWVLVDSERAKYLYRRDTSPISAPNIAEIRERLTLNDFHAYNRVVIGVDNILPNTDWDFAVWLYTVTADADALAGVWLWKETK